ncbi:MAG: amino acid permease [Verrucomicrobia bacterium]|nr:amino acid permease [Verrucomicrobiota bacterium]
MTPGHQPKHQRHLNVFVLAMLCLSVVVSLRNLPLTAEFGLSSISYYLLATVCFMLPYALFSAELASGWPKAGGIYIWVKEALGDRWGFFAIWMQWCHNVTWYPAMLAFIATGLAYPFSPELAQNKHYILSVVLIGFWSITLINFLGIRSSALFSTFCVVIGAIIPGILLISLGAWWVFQGYPSALEWSWKACLPDFSHSSQLVFLAGIFLALSGLEANANHAREVKNPRKNFPRAIFIAALLTLMILILGSLSIATVLPKQNITLVGGLFEAFHAFFSQYHLLWIVPILALFTVLGALGELNAWAIAGVKGLFATTEHGCLPPFFHKMNAKHVPVTLLLFQAVLVTAASLLFLYAPNINLSYWILSALATQMYLIMYLFLLVSTLVLRYRKPLVNRAYQVPGGWIGIWFLAGLGFVSCLFAIIISFLPPLGHFNIPNVWIYELLMISSLTLSCLIPLAIYSFRRPHWQLLVLKDIGVLLKPKF